MILQIRRVRNLIIIILIILFSNLLLLNLNYKSTNSHNKEIVQRIDTSAVHNVSIPIIIDDTDPTKDWDWAVTQEWCSGQGTNINPYVIEDTIFNASGGAFDCLTIQHSIAVFRIKNCQFYNTSQDWPYYKALVFNNVSNGRVLNNYFLKHGYGLWVSECTNITISSNTFEDNNQRALELDGFDQGTIAWNMIKDSIEGILISGDENSVFNNTINSYSVGLRAYGYNNNFTRNYCSNHFNFQSLIDSYIVENVITFSGITLQSSSSNIIYNNSCSKIQLSGSTYSDILENKGLDEGIIISGCNNINVRNNIIFNEGITINGGSFIEINSNILTSVEKGIKVEAGLDITIYNNTIDHTNTYGIELLGNSNCNVSKNSINYGTLCGIFIENEQNSIFRENTLIDCGFFVNDSINDPIELNSTNMVNGKKLLYLTDEIYLDNSDLLNTGQVIIYNCNNTYFSNLNYYQISAGISFISCVNITIIDSQFYSNSLYGIYMYQCQEVRLIDNAAHENGVGICIIDGSEITLTQNNGSFNSGTGIHLMANDHNVIDENLAQHNGMNGIYVDFKSNNIITDNYASYNQFHGIEVTIEDNNYFAGNDAINNGGFGLSFEGNNNNTFTNNVANYNEYTGILFTGKNDSILQNVNAENNWGDGLSIPGASDMTLSGLILSNNGFFGLWIESSIRNTITNNELNGNGEGGIALDNCQNTIILQNTINNNDHVGLSINIGTQNDILENTINRNGYGIHLISVSFSSFAGNTINNNNQEVILMESCNNNSFYSNIMLTNIHGIKMTSCYSNQFLDNKVDSFFQRYGFRLMNSDRNLILNNYIAGGSRGILLQDSSYNNISLNDIRNVGLCFEEIGNCISNIFEDNNCVLAISLLDIIKYSIVFGGLALNGGVAGFLYYRKKKERRD